MTEAKVHYLASNDGNSDIVIANNFVKASEFGIPIGTIVPALKQEGGSGVIISSSPSGQVIHYLMDDFGKTIAGDNFKRSIIQPNLKNLVIFTKYPEAKLYYRFEDPSRLEITDKWSRVLEILVNTHGTSPKVSIYPNADTLYFKNLSGVE